MAYIQPVTIEAANAEQKVLLEKVKAKLGRVPNILGTMATAPAVLKSYLGISEAMAGASLPAAIREQLALAIGEKNNCTYCLAAHTVIGKMNGLSEEDTIDARNGKASDHTAQAAIDFALKVLETNGFVSDADRQAATAAGLNDQQQIEIVGVIALNLLTNRFNHVADTDIDFPAAPAK